MRPGSFSLCAWASIALSTTAWAQVPAGSEFRINAYTTHFQSYPRLAMESDGDFVVVWVQHRGTSYEDVHARRFTARGAAIGDEFRVNAFTTGNQRQPAISLDARGNFVIAWTDDHTYPDRDVFARRVSAAGVALGDDLRIDPSTAGNATSPAVSAAPDGRFVVAWDGTGDVIARRFDAFGNALGDSFGVNTYTTNHQSVPDVSSDPAGNFTVVWQSVGPEGNNYSGAISGQRFGASGQPLGGEFRMNTITTGTQADPALAVRRDGSAVVAWELGGGQPPFDVWVRRLSSSGIPQGEDFRVSTGLVAPQVARDAAIAVDEPGNFVVVWDQRTSSTGQLPLLKVRRFAADGTPRGGEFLVAAVAMNRPGKPVVASDAVGNFVVAWTDLGEFDDVFARRFGGLFPAAMGMTDGGNDVLEVPEDFGLTTSWRNLTGAEQTLQGLSSSVAVPTGLSLMLSPSANYGTIADGGVGGCSPCFAGALSGARPAGHVDLAFVETIVPDVQGQAKRWVLHLGESFTDVSRTSPFYRFVETLLHRGVTAGCAGTAYCPGASTTREQMSVFLLLGKEGAGYAAPPCGVSVFNDVPAASPFCRWIEELARRGVTGGCGGGNFCPAASVTREQMPVFVLRTLDPALDPPACAPPNLFNDVPETSAFCRWIEELARRGVVSGCGGGNYCPTAAVTREQMAVFLTGTFGLTLYGP